MHHPLTKNVGRVTHDCASMLVFLRRVLNPIVHMPHHCLFSRIICTFLNTFLCIRKHKRNHRLSCMGCDQCQIRYLINICMLWISKHDCCIQDYLSEAVCLFFKYCPCFIHGNVAPFQSEKGPCFTHRNEAMFRSQKSVYSRKWATSNPQKWGHV